MSYSDFTLKKVIADFQLTIAEGKSIFSTIAAVATGQHLATTLAEKLPLASALNTAQARG